MCAHDEWKMLKQNNVASRATRATFVRRCDGVDMFGPRQHHGWDGTGRGEAESPMAASTATAAPQTASSGTAQTNPMPKSVLSTTTAPPICCPPRESKLIETCSSTPTAKSDAVRREGAAPPTATTSNSSSTNTREGKRYAERTSEPNEPRCPLHR